MKEERGNWGQGSIFRQKGSRFWWISYYRDGKHFRESSKSTRPNDAKSLLRKRLGQMEAGTFVSPKDRRITVNELVTDLIAWYRAVKLNQRFANDTQSRWDMHLQGFFDNMRADQLGTDQVRQYREKRMAEKPTPSPTTVNRELQVIRKAFRLAAKSTPPKVRTVPQFEMASEAENTRKVFITEDDKQKLREAAATDTSKKAKMKGIHLRVFVELLFSFGWRKGELTGLAVASVNLAQGFIRIEDSKSGEPREVPLTPNLKVLLQAIVAGRQADERLFPATDLRWAWKRLCKRAGVKCGKAGGYVIHDTRRTAARTKRSAGVDETVISRIAGWKPGSKMFARYGIVNRSDMEDAMTRSEQWEEQWEKQQQSKDMHSLCMDASKTVQATDKRDIQ